jgi:hypothetical protein
MLKKILVVLAAVVIVFIVIVATRPSEFRVERSVTINAPAAVIAAEIEDFRKWETWSPWEKMDPGMKRTYEGPASGVGAIYRWDGNEDIGAGSLAITESRPGEVIRMKIEFVRPFACTNDVEFAFKEEAGQTAVTWSMAGRNNFVGKCISLLCNMDKMIGDQYEKGLADLKSVVEGAVGQ